MKLQMRMPEKLPSLNSLDLSSPDIERADEVNAFDGGTGSHLDLVPFILFSGAFLVLIFAAGLIPLMRKGRRRC
jgi:hypothetical protein